MYAVLDLETTGLRTSWHDRVVEIAVVHVDEAGAILDEWCSLVNPDRDLGPRAIHGITAAEARQAPAFAELAGAVAGLLRGRVLVAHNLAFEVVFLHAEFARLGIEVPVGADLGLCTMRLASHFLPSAARSLQDCRRTAGLPMHRAHSALHDARAAAELLAFCLRAAGSPPPWQQMTTHAAHAPWPLLPAGVATPVQRRSPDHREEHFLARLVDRLPRLHQPQADAYLDLLDQALLDRHISACEADTLVAAADTLGLARADAVHLHQQYLAGLAAIAVEDGVVTKAERHDLDTVAALLGLDPQHVQDALDRAGTADATSPGSRPQWELRPGDAVVFTGTMQPAREQWQAEATAAGLCVGDTVTKKTRLLVAADPDSMSGKAKKARQYGIPIVHPSAYQHMLLRLPTTARSGST